MKARFIAVLLSLFVVTLPVQADDSHKKQTTEVNKTDSVSNKIDLNKADVSMLTGSIKGIGKKRAEAIIAYRDSHQGFKSIEELAEVKGIGQHFIETNRDKLKEVFVIS
jgi:competence protein ComEA